MPSAVHPNPLHATNTNELNAYIITAIALLGKVYQFLCGLWQRRAMSGNFANIFGVYRIVQAIGTKQQYIAGANLVLAGIHTQKHVIAQRPAQHMRDSRPAGLARGHGAHAELFIGKGVIARDGRGIALADQDSSVNHPRAKQWRDRSATRKPPSWSPYCYRSAWRS